MVLVGGTRGQIIMAGDPMQMVRKMRITKSNNSFSFTLNYLNNLLGTNLFWSRIQYTWTFRFDD